MARRSRLGGAVVGTAALILACLTTSGPLAAPAAADAARSPEWLPFAGTYRVSATWSAGGYHGYPAIDFVLPSGTPVYASGSGTVAYAVVDNRTCDPNAHADEGGITWCQQNGYADSGTRVKIGHPDGRSSLYMHLSSIKSGIAAGTKVTAGQQIGWSGNTGISTGAHLHYQENDASGGAVDPGVLVACHGSATYNYANPQGLVGSAVRNDGYGCHPSTAAAAVWSPGGGVPSLGATVGVHADGRLQVYAVGGDRRVHTRDQRSPSGSWREWSAWPDAGGLTLRLPVTSASHKDGRQQVWVAGVDGQLRTRIQTRPNGPWSRWVLWAGYRHFPMLTPVAVAAQRDGRLQVFAVGADRRIHSRLQQRPNGPWGSWVTWGGYAGFPAATPIAVGANKDGRLQVLAIGSDGRVHARVQRAANRAFGAWAAWGGYRGFSPTTPISAALNKNGRMQVFAVGANGRVYSRVQRSAGGAWGGWVAWAAPRPFPQRTLVTPARNRDGRLQIFAVGTGGRVYTKTQVQANGGWRAWAAWGDPKGFTPRTPVLVRMQTNGRLQAFAVGGGGRMYTREQDPDRSWTNWAAWGAYDRFIGGAGLH